MSFIFQSLSIAIVADWSRRSRYLNRHVVRCEDEAVISIPEKELTVPSGENAIDVNNGAELMQETHVCFFSLLRDAFTSKGEYRMSTVEMKEAVTQWQGNPISPLNDW